VWFSAPSLKTKLGRFGGPIPVIGTHAAGRVRFRIEKIQTFPIRFP
jgi:hypothetical protein